MVIDPLVTVVIPSYNHSKFVGKTIDSIVAQTIFDQIELIIIDDGSKDNSIKVIERKLSEYPDANIIFRKRENRGLCRTLNESLGLSRGKYFSYIGSDDWLAPQKIERQMAAMAASGENTAACYTDTFIVDQDDNVLDTYGRQYDYRGGDIYHDLVEMRIQPPSPTNMFLKEALLSIGGFVPHYFIEDKDTWIKIAKIYRIAYVDEPLAYFRMHQTNTSNTYPDKMHDYFREVLKDLAKTDPLLMSRKSEIDSYILNLEAGSYYELLQLGKAKTYSLRSLLKNPLNKMSWRTLLFSLLGKRLIKYFRARRRVQIQADVKA
jgi:glycosyltransferase involved in cell wall biosynthesis